MPISKMKKLRSRDLQQLREKHMDLEVSCPQATSSLSWAPKLHDLPLSPLVWVKGDFTVPSTIVIPTADICWTLIPCQAQN